MSLNNVERFNSVMSFQKPDRLPVVEWAHWWDKTIDRWHGEGLPETMKDAGEIRDYLGLDCYQQLWATCITENCPHPAKHGASVISNSEQYDMILPALYPANTFDKRIVENWALSQKSGETVIWFTLEGFFWHPRVLFGIEEHMYAFYDRAKLMHRINEDLLKFHLKVIDDICGICSPGFVTIAEDMSYNHGPMLSKPFFDEFLAPYYRELVPELKKRGIYVFVDSDGDVTPLIPWLKEVGVEGILPLERQANIDVAKIRKEHPDFRMIGGFDKTVMHLGEDAMRNEFERLLPVMRQGGYIASVDHQTPPDVSLAKYRVYIRLLSEYCQKAIG